MSKNFYSFIKYLFFFVLFVVLQHARIGALNSFAFGMFFCLIWCGQSALILSPLYVLSAFLKEFAFIDVVFASGMVVVFLIFYFLHFKLKKPLNLVILGVYAFLSQVPYLYINSNIASEFFEAILSVFCGLVFMYCCITIMQNLLIRGLRRRFYVDELICGGVVLIVISAGMFCLPYGQFVSVSVATFFILLSLWTLGPSKSIVVGALIGIGLSLSAQNISFIVRFVILAISASTMLSNKKIFSVLAVILVDAIIELYLLPYHSLTMLMCVGIGAFLFFLLPNKTIKFFNAFIVTEQQNNAVFSMLQRSKRSLEQKLDTMHNIFLEMRNSFLSLVKNNYATTDAIEYINANVQNTICSRCPNRNECLFLNFQETNFHITELAKIAYQRGSLSVVDASPVFAKKCVRLNVVVNAIKNLSSDFKQVAFNLQNNNETKLMLAEQLNGVAEVFKNLCFDVSKNLVFDDKKESEIIESLSKAQVLCTECLVYCNGNMESVNLTIRKRDFLPKRIEKVVSSVLNTKMEVHSTMHSTQKQFENVLLTTKRNFELVYGCSGATKFGSLKSGDTYSVSKLDNNKVMFSICDGMGSGKTAKDVSMLSISLIENFYKVGFESNVILKIVNGMLSQRGEEQFSAIDLGIVDLYSGILDLYKVGAPCSFLKHKNSVEVLKTGALPLGIVNDVVPYSQNVLLKGGDYVILVSDGVVDEVGGVKELAKIIDDMPDTNPQALANELIEFCLKHSLKNPKDDMTALVVKLISNF